MCPGIVLVDEGEVVLRLHDHGRMRSAVNQSVNLVEEGSLTCAGCDDAHPASTVQVQNYVRVRADLIVCCMDPLTRDSERQGTPHAGRPAHQWIYPLNRPTPVGYDEDAQEVAIIGAVQVADSRAAGEVADLHVA